jgi:hypothetical protein
MFTLLTLAASFAIAFSVSLVGFVVSRRFVENRLRYVDAVQSPFAAILAGGVATLIALPIVAILPFVGLGTAIFFGVGVLTGVASGAREIRRRIGAG